MQTTLFEFHIPKDYANTFLGSTDQRENTYYG